MYCDMMHYFRDNISSAARVIFRFLFCAIQIAAVVSVSSCSEPKRPAPQADVLSRSLRQEKIENMINTGRYREAIALLDRFSQDYDLPPREMLDVYYNLAYCYQATGDYDRVLDNIACIMNLQMIHWNMKRLTVIFSLPEYTVWPENHIKATPSFLTWKPE